MSAPLWLLTLPGGVLADHADRRRVIAGFQSLQMLCPIAIVALLLTGIAHPWGIIAMSLVVGITDALSMPSFSSIVPSIVSHEQIPAGLALNSTQFNVSRIVGPAVAGILMATVGAIGCFVVSAVSYVPFIGIALWILPRQTGARRHRHGNVDSIPSRACESCAMPACAARCSPRSHPALFADPSSFCPVLVRTSGMAARRSSVWRSAPSVLAACWAASVCWESILARSSQICAVLHLYGVMLIAIALDPGRACLPVLFVVAGVTMSVTNTSANTFVQSAAAANLRGQAVSLFMLAPGAEALGGLATGLSVELFGIRNALLINGALAVITQLQIGRMWRRRPAGVRVEAGFILLPLPRVHRKSTLIRFRPARRRR